jgi:hypothetical protein
MNDTKVTFNVIPCEKVVYATGTTFVTSGLHKIAHAGARPYIMRSNLLRQEGEGPKEKQILIVSVKRANDVALTFKRSQGECGSHSRHALSRFFPLWR